MPNSVVPSCKRSTRRKAQTVMPAAQKVKRKVKQESTNSVTNIDKECLHPQLRNLLAGKPVEVNFLSAHLSNVAWPFARFNPSTISSKDHMVLSSNVSNSLMLTQRNVNQSLRSADAMQIDSGDSGNIDLDVLDPALFNSQAVDWSDDTTASPTSKVVDVDDVELSDASDASDAKWSEDTFTDENMQNVLTAVCQNERR